MAIPLFYSVNMCQHPRRPIASACTIGGRIIPLIIPRAVRLFRHRPAARRHAVEARPPRGLQRGARAGTGPDRVPLRPNRPFCSCFCRKRRRFRSAPGPRGDRVRHALTYQQRCERLRRCSTSPNSTSMAASSAADGIVHREGPSSRTRKSSQVSPGYRSQCRLRTGAASAKCRAGTGARVSPSYRNLTAMWWRSWSGRRDSNPRPSAWEARWLPQQAT